MTNDDLHARWQRLMQRLGAAPAEAEFEQLVVAYGEPHRAYHTLDHLRELFAALDAVPLDDPAVALAVWYHDVVYRPGRADNEARSARLAARSLARLGLAPTLIARVEQLVLATAGHAAADDDEPQALFLDADLAILGAAPARYDAYAAEVRREHARIPAPLYRRGRARFLREMLERPRLYATAHFHDRCEVAARSNMRRELAALGG